MNRNFRVQLLRIPRKFFKNQLTFPLLIQTHTMYYVKHLLEIGRKISAAVQQNYIYCIATTTSYYKAPYKLAKMTGNSATLIFDIILSQSSKHT